jgi:hypothetical protein
METALNAPETTHRESLTCPSCLTCLTRDTLDTFDTFPGQRALSHVLSLGVP